MQFVITRFVINRYHCTNQCWTSGTTFHGISMEPELWNLPFYNLYGMEPSSLRTMVPWKIPWNFTDMLLSSSRSNSRETTQRKPIFSDKLSYFIGHKSREFLCHYSMEVPWNHGSFQVPRNAYHEMEWNLPDRANGVSMDCQCPTLKGCDSFIQEVSHMMLLSEAPETIRLSIPTCAVTISPALALKSIVQLDIQQNAISQYLIYP